MQNIKGSIVKRKVFLNNLSLVQVKQESEKNLVYYKKLRNLKMKELEISLDLISNSDKTQLTLFTKALYMLDEKERELIEVRYLDKTDKQVLDYEAVGLLNISERQFYRIKSSALLNYYRNLCLLTLKQHSPLL